MMGTTPEDGVLNWVAERAKCTLASRFECLVKTIKHDVAEINRQVSSMRHGQLFTVESNADGCVKVRRYPENCPTDTSGYVTFELLRKTITAHLPGEISFDISPKWNEKELRCDLLVEDEPHDLWQISQKALGLFFFEGE